MTLKLTEIRDKIFLVSSSSQKEVNETFLRFQEYYESPKFAGRPFTIGEFRVWYSENYGGWTYFTDWSGFNIPSRILLSFYDGLFDPLTSKEKKFLKLFKEVEGDYYIVGCKEGNLGTLSHEISHGLFYLNKDYKEEMTNLVNSLPKETRDNMEIRLRSLGYAEEVFVDEIQAYMCDSKEMFGFPISESISKSFRNIRSKYEKVRTS